MRGVGSTVPHRQARLCLSYLRKTRRVSYLWERSFSYRRWMARSAERRSCAPHNIMKDRLVELQQVREGKTPPAPSSTIWHDQLVERMRDAPNDKVQLVPAKRRTRFFKRKGLKTSIQNHEMDTFLAKLRENVHRIKSEVSHIQNNTREIRALHTKDLLVPGLDPSEKRQMASLDKNTRETNSRILKHFKELESMNVPDNAAVQRIHSVQLSQELAAFKHAVEAYEAELGRYAKLLHQQVAKQIAIANGTSQAWGDSSGSDSGVDPDSVEDGKLQIFVDNYLAAEQQARGQLRDVQDRHKELAELEESLTQVRDLFAQVAVLVMTQGDLIDNIEAHVEAANAEVAKGRKNLVSAKKKQRSANKKKVILATVGTAVATGLVATLVLL